LEKKHPFNTGRMARLSNSELIVAETLSASQLVSILKTPSVAIQVLPVQSQYG